MPFSKPYGHLVPWTVSQSWRSRASMTYSVLIRCTLQETFQEKHIVEAESDTQGGKSSHASHQISTTRVWVLTAPVHPGSSLSKPVREHLLCSITVFTRVKHWSQKQSHYSDRYQKCFNSSNRRRDPDSCHKRSKVRRECHTVSLNAPSSAEEVRCVPG